MVLEAVPGATIHNFYVNEKNVNFMVESREDLQLTLELEPSMEYKILIDDVNVGKIKTSLAGKVSFSIEVKADTQKVMIEKIG